jgi:sec-independent protein translocase protein TatA
MHTLFAIFGLGPMEIVVLVVLGVLLFGKNLPSMGRYIGKSIVEFKKGVKGLEDDVETGVAPRNDMAAQDQPQLRPPQRVGVTAPKFEDVPANVPSALRQAREELDTRVAPPKVS